MDIVASIEKAGAEIKALVPQSIQHELGAYGTALVANVKHDLSVLKADAAQLVEADLEQLWAAAKSAAVSVFSDPALLKAGYEMKLSAVVDILKADAQKSGFLTLIESMAAATLANLVRTAGSMAVAGLISAA